MKAARIIRKDLNGMLANVYLVENDQDLADYERFVNKITRREIGNVLKDTLPIQKFDHMWGGKPAISRGIMVHAWHLANLNSIQEPESLSIWSNPLWQMLPAASIKIETLRRFLDAGHVMLVNHAGGFMPYSKRDVEILEVYDADMSETRIIAPKPKLAKADETLKPITDFAGVEDGWLLPDGRFFRCEHFGHSELTTRICRQPWSADLENGWIELTGGEWVGPHLLTQRQFDTMWDWCQANNQPMDPDYEVK